MGLISKGPYLCEVFGIVDIHIHCFWVPNVLMAVVLLLIHSLLLLPLFVGVLCLVLSK